MRKILTAMLTTSHPFPNGSVTSFISYGTFLGSRISNVNGTGHKLLIETMATERRAQHGRLSSANCTGRHVHHIRHVKYATRKRVRLLVRTSLNHIHTDRRGLKCVCWIHVRISFCQEGRGKPSVLSALSIVGQCRKRSVRILLQGIR